MAKEDELNDGLIESTQILGMIDKDGDAFSTVQLQDVAKLDQEIAEDADEEETETDETQEEEETETDDTEAETEEGEESEESEEEEEEESDENDSDDVNPYYALAQSLIKDGFLSEEADIDDEIGGAELKDLYKSSIEQKAYDEIRAEVLEDLNTEGVNENTILYARAIQSGIDISQLNAAARIERYASVNVESISADDRVRLVKEWHKDRKLSDEESKKLLEDVEIDEGDEGVTKLAEKAKEYYKNQFKDYRENQSKLLDESRIAQKKARVESEKKVNSMLTKREIRGEKITKDQAKEIKNAIYNKTEKVEVDGQTYNVTEFQKFLHKMNRDEETQLLMFKKFKYLETDRQTIKKEVKGEVEDDFLQGYKKSVKKDLTPKRKTKRKSKKINDLTEKATIINFG